MKRFAVAIVLLALRHNRHGRLRRPPNDPGHPAAADRTTAGNQASDDDHLSAGRHGNTGTTISRYHRRLPPPRQRRRPSRSWQPNCRS